MRPCGGLLLRGWDSTSSSLQDHQHELSFRLAYIFSYNLFQFCGHTWILANTIARFLTFGQGELHTGEREKDAMLCTAFWDPGYPLFQVHCFMSIVSCPLFHVHCFMFIVSYPLFHVHSFMSIVLCSLFQVHCFMFIVSYPLFHVHSFMSIVLCPLFQVHCFMFIVSCPLFHIHCFISSFISIVLYP
ncbi:hypothetical protein EYF80_062588 [Liparis tanakae]|uniref:Uncharacterized protein n=1 Tax=Liparis tanakae TaxID=230148 RepID=A0A4Z2EER0_9TELE|nr:hypothetical protein EYF80_062588 [Liparis tanakae]